MRPAPLSHLPAGGRIARDVITGRPGDLPLLRAGTLVTERYRDALVRHGIHAVYVEDELSDGIEVTPIISERTRQEATTALASAFESTPLALGSGLPLP